MKRPKTNTNWLWGGLGAFFIAVIIFKIGEASAKSNLEGNGKKVGIAPDWNYAKQFCNFY